MVSVAVVVCANEFIEELSKDASAVVIIIIEIAMLVSVEPIKNVREIAVTAALAEEVLEIIEDGAVLRVIGAAAVLSRSTITVVGHVVGWSMAAS